MICSVVLRPTDPLDNASTEVSNLTLPQNSPALFVRRDPSIRFLDYDCEIIPYFSRNVSKEKKLRTEKKKKKKASTNSRLSSSSKRQTSFSTWSRNYGRFPSARVLFLPIARVGDRLAARSIIEILGSHPSSPRAANTRSQFS